MFYNNLAFSIISLFLLYLYFRRKFNLLHILFFVTPFLNWSFDIGLNLTMFQIITIILIVITLINNINEKKYLLITEKPLIFFILYMIISTIFISNFIIENYMDLGSFTRNEGRFIGQIIFWLILFSIIPIMKNYINSFSDIYNYLKIYINALILLIILGWIQFSIFSVTGTDIFPLYVKDGHSVSGIWGYMDEQVFRVSSLGGEPKGFALSLTVGFFIIQIFNKQNIKFYKYDGTIKILMVITIIATLSTSGFVMFIILYFVYMIYSFKFFGLGKLNLKKIIKLLSLFIIILFILNKNSQVFSTIYQEKILDRNITSEDYDAPIQKMFLDKPQYLLFGSGVGNIHNLAAQYIPQEYLHYMKDNIFVAKSGYLRIISELGLLGMFLFLNFNFLLILSVYRSKIIKKEYIFILIGIMIISLFAYLSRSYLLNIYILIVSLLYSTLKLQKKEIT